MSTPANLELLWNQFSSNLRSFIFSRVKNDADTDDILQDVFTKIHEHIHTVKDSSKIKPWIYQVTRNVIVDHFRSNKIRHDPDLFKDGQMDSSSYSKTMDKAIRDMVEMMDELPGEYCEALCMTEIDGVSQKEYARIKGLSYSGAKSRVQRARELLKEMLLKCCHYQFDRYGNVIDTQPKCCCCCKD